MRVPCACSSRRCGTALALVAVLSAQLQCLHMPRETGPRSPARPKATRLRFCRYALVHPARTPAISLCPCSAMRTHMAREMPRLYTIQPSAEPSCPQSGEPRGSSDVVRDMSRQIRSTAAAGRALGVGCACSSSRWVAAAPSIGPVQRRRPQERTRGQYLLHSESGLMTVAAAQPAS